MSSHIHFPNEGEEESSESDSESAGDEDAGGTESAGDEDAGGTESAGDEDAGGTESAGDEDAGGTKSNYSEMTMEELLELQEEMGMKEFKRKVLVGHQQPSSSEDWRGKEDTGESKCKKFKRANKNRPSEVPMMRRAAPRIRSLDPRQKIKRKPTRDPRFDDLSGKLNVKVWKDNYGFLRETRRKEKEILKKELKAEDDPFKKRKLKSIIQRMENQEIEQAKRDQEMEIMKNERQQQKEALKQGRKPKFITNKDRKLLIKAAQFEQLKKENKVDKYLKRKEKRKRVKELKGQRDN